ncbi:MAG TPA: FAD-binding oxidoreductase [Thermoleophilaceae bacterium]|jgi:UDP-N-acetylenolpyruvoylglucosamine reductase
MTPIAPELRSLVRRVVTAGDPGWDDARQAFNLLVDQLPSAVVFPESAEEVAHVVGFAREHGLRVAPQSTGHNAGPLGSLEGTLLVRTSRMNRFEIDPEARRARVEAGVLWQDVVPQAAEHGLAALHGSSPNVGVVGYTLGGGLGWLARKHGLAANSVQAVELVTADGGLLRADRDTEPDLFWALRGGGGSFGVVTAIEFALHPVADLYAGAMFFPFERASEVLHAWREWTAATPDEVTSVGRILQLPPVPDIPEPLRGGSFAVVEAAFLGTEADGAELLRPLRELGPGMDTLAAAPLTALSGLHMDPEHPVPALTEHSMIRDLPAEGVDAFVGAAGPGSGSPLLTVELRQLGGALARPEPGHGASAALDGEFAMFAVGVPSDSPEVLSKPEIAAAVVAGLGQVKAALAPYATGRGYSNFVETARGMAGLFDAETCGRLSAVKAKHDPGNVFRANHPIEPTA